VITQETGNSPITGESLAIEDLLQIKSDQVITDKAEHPSAVGSQEVSNCIKEEVSMSCENELNTVCIVF
jgi:hypothetical protein